jgi:hypothetical protein
MITPGGFMNRSTKLISVAAAAALVAGAGAMAAAPATASGKAAIGGTTIIEVPLALVGAAQAAGVTIAPIAPSRAQATSDIVGVTFPITGPADDGALFHRGGLSFASSNTNITLTASKPLIGWPTDGSSDDATISVTVGGIPDGHPFASANGQSLPVFDVKGYDRTIKKGKPKGKGKKWTRVDTITMTGPVTVTTNTTVVDVLNGLLMSPGGTLFTPGMAFGTLNSVETITHRCTSQKACR